MRHHATLRLSIILAAALLWADARAAEIKVLSSAAVKEAYMAIVPGFERQTGHKISTVWDGTVNIAKRIRSGEVFDIVIIPPKEIEHLASEGKLVSGSRTDFVKSGIGVAVREGAPKPDIS